MRRLLLSLIAFLSITAAPLAAAKNNSSAIVLPLYLGISKGLVMGLHYDLLDLKAVTDIENLQLEANAFVDLGGQYGMAAMVKYRYPLDESWQFFAKVGPAFIVSVDGVRFLQYGVSAEYRLNSDITLGAEFYAESLNLAYHWRF